MQTYVYVLQIVLAVALVGAILLQAKGSGLGSIFGGDGAVFRSRRGVEKLLFNATIVLAGLFLLVSLLSATLASG